MILPALIPTNLQYEVRIHPYAEVRERLERHINPTFSSPADKNRSDLYSRYRVGVDIEVNRALTAKLEYQYAQDTFWTQASNGSADASDVSQAYLRYSNGPGSATVGRQKIEMGQQRLIGSTEWLNLARSFDGGRASYGQWEAWSGRLGVANNKPESARMGALIHADKTRGATSFIYKHDLGKASGIDVQTIDQLTTQKIGQTTIAAEGAAQFGSNNGRDQRAWAWHLRASSPILPHTQFKVEANAASGGGNATTSRTFDNLYPSNHDLYGLADLTAWKNMNDVAFKVENKSFKGLTLQSEFHILTLRDPSDAWYGATGSANPRTGGTFIDPTGNSGRDLGNELDFSASYAKKSGGTFSLGVSFFDPGRFVQNLSGHSNQLTYGYLQYQARF